VSGSGSGHDHAGGGEKSNELFHSVIPLKKVGSELSQSLGRGKSLFFHVTKLPLYNITTNEYFVNKVLIHEVWYKIFYLSCPCAQNF
ncbi:hypothetical protein, partial [Mailhella sp.]